jgi:hypothetical protein
MKSVPLTLVFIALLAFTTVMNAQEQSGEQAVRRVVADFAELSIVATPRPSPHCLQRTRTSS